MKKALIGLVLIVSLFVAIVTHAWMGSLLGSGGGQSATGCSTPTGDVMHESFGDDSTACTSGGTEACVNTWTISGDSQTFKESMPGSPPSGSCTYGLLSDTANESGERIYLDVGDAISYETSTDTVFSIYFDDATIDANQNITIVSLGASNSAANANWTFKIYNSSGTYKIYVNGADQTALQTISMDTWYKIKVHSDGTAANSYLQINDGSQISFTRADQNKEYMAIGSLSNEGVGEAVKFYIGYIYVDNP